MVNRGRAGRGEPMSRGPDIRASFAPALFYRSCWPLCARGEDAAQRNQALGRPCRQPDHLPRTHTRRSRARHWWGCGRYLRRPNCDYVARVERVGSGRSSVLRAGYGIARGCHREADRGATKISSGRSARARAGIDRHAAQRRGQGQPVFPAASTSITAPISTSRSTTCRSTCVPMGMARAMPISIS